jgi:acyl carrier protein
MMQNILGLSTDEYDDSTSFGPDGLDVDSLQIVEMIETGEAELDMQVPDDEIEAVDTVGGVREVFSEYAD